MIHPTRTNLLLLRDRSRSVVNSVALLHGRHQALMREFLALSAPFLRSREAVQATYGHAIDELQQSTAREGEETIAWAWDPAHDSPAYWEAGFDRKVLAFPIEPLPFSILPPDGWFDGRARKPLAMDISSTTLIIASCDPAAGFLSAAGLPRGAA